MIPTWLAEHLQALGRSDGDGVRRAAKLTHCRKCSSPVIVGLDADRCALVAKCDVQPISPLGELQAIATGRATYNLAVTAARIEIDARHPWAISGQRKHPVIAEHACHSPPLDPDSADRAPLAIRRPEYIQPPY